MMSPGTPFSWVESSAPATSPAGSMSGVWYLARTGSQASSPGRGSRVDAVNHVAIPSHGQRRALTGNWVNPSLGPAPRIASPAAMMAEAFAGSTGPAATTSVPAN